MSTVHQIEVTTDQTSEIPTNLVDRSVRRLRVDEEGRLIPPTVEELAASREAYLAGLAELALLPDDPPGSDEEFWRAIDSERPERPLFRDYYQP